jgi:hypothetical protein
VIRERAHSAGLAAWGSASTAGALGARLGPQHSPARATAQPTRPLPATSPGPAALRVCPWSAGWGGVGSPGGVPTAALCQLAGFGQVWLRVRGSPSSPSPKCSAGLLGLPVPVVVAGPDLGRLQRRQCLRLQGGTRSARAPVMRLAVSWVPRVPLGMGCVCARARVCVCVCVCVCCGATLNEYSTDFNSFFPLKAFPKNVEKIFI